MAKTFTVELKNGRILKNVTEKQAKLFEKVGASILEVGKKPPELSIPREITNPIKLKGPEPIISKPEVKEVEVEKPKAQVKEIDLDAKPEIPYLEAEEETEEKAKPKTRAKRTKK